MDYDNFAFFKCENINCMFCFMIWYSLVGGYQVFWQKEAASSLFRVPWIPQTEVIYNYATINIFLFTSFSYQSMYCSKKILIQTIKNKIEKYYFPIIKEELILHWIQRNDSGMYTLSHHSHENIGYKTRAYTLTA